MAKLGPFQSSDNCSAVRGVMDRLITHLLVLPLLVHVSLELEGGSLGAVLGAVVEVESVLMEGVGAMSVAGTAGLLEVWEEVLENWMASFSIFIC